MTDILFHAHSGVRYLVLLAAIVAVILLAAGRASGKPFAGGPRIAASAFAGLLDLQVLLGIGLALTGIFYSALAGHILMMILAAAAAHVLLARAKKEADPRRAHATALIGIALALVLIVGGILSIGRGVFGTSGQPTVVSAG